MLDLAIAIFIALYLLVLLAAAGVGSYCIWLAVSIVVEDWRDG